MTSAGTSFYSRQTYFPYGAQRTTEGSALPTDYTFTEQKNDDSTGLMFYGARYYDVTLGRFIQADTLVPSPLNPQSLNRFGYVLNNPIKYIDPTGHTVPCDVDPECGQPGNWTPPPAPNNCQLSPADPGCPAASPPTPPATTGGNQGPSDCPELDPALCNDSGNGDKDKGKGNGSGGDGICAIDPSETECNKYKRAIQQVKDMCMRAGCYDERIWFTIDVSMKDPEWFSRLQVEASRAYAEQGLDLALIVDQGIDDPLQLTSGTYGLTASVAVINHIGDVIPDFLSEVRLSADKPENYETLFLMKQIENHPLVLFNVIYSCTQDPFCNIESGMIGGE